MKLLTVPEHSYSVNCPHCREKFGIEDYIDPAHQAQLDKVLQEQSKALRDYTDNKISFERLAERMGINFYGLYTAFEKYKGTISIT
jgi:hypothetical protein